MPIYFALEGIVGSGKMTLLEWLKVMLLEDGYTFYMIPEPVDKFKKKVTYNPLEECYKCPATKHCYGTNTYHGPVGKTLH